MNTTGMINQVYTEKYIKMYVREKLWKICILNQVRYYEQKFLDIFTNHYYR
jgi:hypothetical protein